MKAKIFDGNKLAGKYLEEVAEYTKNLKIKPKLSTILVGENESSSTYIRIKEKTCKRYGIDVNVYRISTDTELVTLIHKLNMDNSVNGILVQLPLPNNISEREIISFIDPLKDVDGLHPSNIGKLAYGDETLPACTPFGIIKIIEDEKINLEGLNVVILGRSIHVGKPLCSMLVNRNATVTLCHTKTKNIQKFISDADMVIVAVGKPNYINEKMIKDGAIVIDVGINKVGKRITGDVDFDSVKNRASFLTPVPGGVGPMTVAMLAKNVVTAHRLQRGG